MTGAQADGPLRDRTAVVTGAGRGIGRALALALAGAGADVAVAGRNAKQLRRVAEEIRGLGTRALPITTDVTVTAQVDRLMDRAAAELGGLDILVNNSGVLGAGDSLDVTDDDWDTVMATNARGTFACSRAAGRYMIPAGHGKIVNVASNFAFHGVARCAAYCASKGAIVSLTRALAVEWAPHNVQVNALAPGYFGTDFNAAARADPDLNARILRQVPARRVGEPEELGPWVVLLASDASDFMTGEAIVIDGGQMAR
ncbi:MAG: glucose 1-dehydrogenase [Streptosporangiales bacterium]|nr:glucose 1-dehydrogenase [Streptosporangiales bacterium]